MNIGKSIKLAMVGREWTQKHLASLLGVHGPAMSRLVRSKECGGDRLRKLADIFGMRVSEFVALGEDGATTLAAPVSAPVRQEKAERHWVRVDADSFPKLLHGCWIEAKNNQESLDAQYQSSDDEYWWLGRDGKEVTVTHYR